MNAQARSIISWIIIGLIAGLIASLLVGVNITLLYCIIAGLVGSIVGGFLAQLLGFRLNTGNPFLDQIVIAAVGAIIVLIVAPMII